MNINEKIYRNVKALCKIYGKDMKEVETAVGKSAGYLSRKNTKVEVETLVKLADIFEVSCDELMKCDFEHELEMKETIEDLKSAVTKATQFLTVEGIMNVIKPMLCMEDEDEGTK